MENQNELNRDQTPVFLKYDELPEKTQKAKNLEYTIADAVMNVAGGDAFRGCMDVDYGRRGERPQIWKLFLWKAKNRVANNSNNHPSAPLPKNVQRGGD